MKVQQVSPGIINKIKSLIARVGYLKSDIGIVEDTDTATHTISSGQYVIWKNELYKASTAIPSGDPLSSTNLTAVSDGIANELNSKITTVDETSAFPATGRTLSKNYVRKYGRDIEVIIASDTMTPGSNTWINIATLPTGDAYIPRTTIDFAAINNADDTAIHARIESGVIKVYGKAGVSLAPLIHIKFTSNE